ncbi:MAG: 30S ribosomal protein S2 [Candidatus Aenigmarchaeota archaeon]|nr:30S ribosomal protein S2 [Candidatus Aenigmarchaeota archaeon]
MPYEQFLSAGMHIGMKQQTKDMERFVYKLRDDGLAVLDLKTIEKRIKLAAQFLSRFDRIMVVSRKFVGWKPATKFAEVVGAKELTGRFLPGTITNPAFPGYYEPEVLLVTDPLMDAQAIKEAGKMRIPIIALSDTCNETGLIDFVIPINNKGRKSLAMVYYLLAMEIEKCRGKIKEDEEFAHKPEDFETEDRRKRREE